MTEARQASLLSLATALAAAGLAAVLLHEPIAAFGEGLWGPENAWTNRDFLGAFWLFWAAGRPGDELAMLAFPDGALPVQHHVPNPFDAWILGPLTEPASFVAWWNGIQLAHHLGNIAAAALLARALGARGLSAVGAVALVAASPVMLHEIAGGRSISGMAWPGLLGLALLARGRATPAGLLLGVQGLGYLYTGALFAVVAAVLRPRTALRAAPLVALVWAPYLAWLWPVFQGLHGHPPPAGHTALPLAGLLGLGAVPERFQVHPALLLGLPVAIVLRRWRLLAVALLALLVALGPRPAWVPGDPVTFSPLAWLQWLSPALARLHHPVRAALALLPLLAVPLALGLDRLPRWAVVVPLGLAVWTAPGLERAVAWGIPSTPPGVEQARWLREHADAVVDLTGEHGAALGLQPFHERPMLESLKRERATPDRQAGALRARATGWLAGEPQPGLARDLRAAGLSHVVVVDRGQAPDLAALEGDLGPPVAPGIYALDRPGRDAAGEGPEIDDR